MSAEKNQISGSSKNSIYRNLKVKYRPIDSLKPNKRNTRTHSKKQIRQIARSIQEFGFTNPILVDGIGIIIAGHGRIEAARLISLNSVPCICIDDLTEEQIRAYALADNQLALNAGWDQELLGQELQYLTELDIDFDVTITGFETAEIDLLIDGLASIEDDLEADQIPKVDPDTPPISEIGDLYLLGRHRLLCEDATKQSSFDQLMGRQRAQMIITDPPYNVPIDGHTGGLGNIHHDDFVMASGEMSELEFTSFLQRTLGHLVTYSTNGSIHYLFMDWRHLYEIQTAARSVYSEFKNLIVWNKSNAGMGSFYRSQHELILVFKNGKAPHINNFGLGENGRHRSNVWSYPGLNSFGTDRNEHLNIHPTVKPVGLIADAIKDCSQRGAIVLDPFAGSGTILIASEKTGRKAYAMELDPRYVDTAIRRWEDYTGENAIHAESGLTFEQLKEERGNG